MKHNLYNKSLPSPYFENNNNTNDLISMINTTKSFAIVAEESIGKSTLVISTSLKLIEDINQSLKSIYIIDLHNCSSYNDLLNKIVLELIPNNFENNFEDILLIYFNRIKELSLFIFDGTIFDLKFINLCLSISNRNNNVIILNYYFKKKLD